MYDIIIIGAGTAGMTAAIYGARAGKKILILEGKSYGGQIINSQEVENYPGIQSISGFDFATNLFEQMKSFHIDVKFEQVLSLDPKEKIVKTKQNQYKGKSIILALGAKNRSLGLPKEQEFVGKGISYCATCDGPLYKNKIVAVVGGGNTALEDANFLSAYCKKVYLIHRREEFRGEDYLVENLRTKKNVTFLFNTKITEIIGEKQIKAIKITTEKQEEILEIEGLFIMIGQVPSTDLCQQIIDLDEKGYIIASENCQTNQQGIFVAGDCRTKKIRQLATAASDGAIAALMACEYLENEK